jgi:hypothetical protein
MKRKQKENEGKIQSKPIWHYIVDFDGYANSDKRYETRLKDDDGNYLHYDLPEMEKAFLTKEEIKKKIDNKMVWKCKNVKISDVNEQNFHNLLSEFHLRKEKIESISEKEFYTEIEKIERELHDIKLGGN